MFPRLTIEQHRSDLITGEVEVGGLIARRRDSTSLDKPLRFDNLADAFRAAWEAVHELRNEPVPMLVLGGKTEHWEALSDPVEWPHEQAPAPSEINDLARSLQGEAKRRQDEAAVLDTAPPAPKRRGRPRRNVG